MMLKAPVGSGHLNPRLHSSMRVLQAWRATSELLLSVEQPTLLAAMPGGMNNQPIHSSFPNHPTSQSQPSRHHHASPPSPPHRSRPFVSEVRAAMSVHRTQRCPFSFVVQKSHPLCPPSPKAASARPPVIRRTLPAIRPKTIQRSERDKRLTSSSTWKQIPHQALHKF